MIRPGFRYFLGAADVTWLARSPVPLLVSRPLLARRAAPPRARSPWMLDSGAFLELRRHRGWTVTPAAYAREVRALHARCGSLVAAATQDWTCDPRSRAATGRDVAWHQARTVESWLDLRARAPELPWMPVLQGWSWGDYLEHAEAYARVGCDLRAEPLVGVGSLALRQATPIATAVLGTLAAAGLRLHAFGLSARGLPALAPHCASGDSMAWSWEARRGAPLAGHPHRSCKHCLPYALAWRARALDA